MGDRAPAAVRNAKAGTARLGGKAKGGTARLGKKGRVTATQLASKPKGKTKAVKTIPKFGRFKGKKK